MKLHKKIEAELPSQPPADEPAKVVLRQDELARKIREARKQASAGNILTPEITREFRRLIALTMRGAQGARIEDSLRRSEPVRFPVTVNATYPPGVPLQTSPPTLLQNLPKLPKELEYRIVGHDLILLDVNASLIVDYMSEAIP